MESPSPAPSLAPVAVTAQLERFLLAAFFTSGVTGLIFEVVWTRELVLIFGATSLAISSVLAAYMAGLGLGSLVGGRLADRLERPLLAYGLLEAGVAAYGLLVPFLVKGLEPLYRVMYRSLAPQFLTFSLLRFGVLFLVLLIPTTLMGATLPVLSRFVSQGVALSETTVSRLYAANTTGAVAGTLLAGFYLLADFGVRFSNLTAVAVGFSLSAGVLIWANKLGVTPKAQIVEKPVAPAPDSKVDVIPEFDEQDEAPAPWAIALGFGLAGAASMILEVSWTRALVQLLGPSTYAFSVMLATFLVGIALGSAVTSRFLDRLKQPALLFAMVEGLVAAMTAVGVLGFEPISQLYRVLSGVGAGGRGPLSLGMKSLVSAVLMMPATLLIGASFPLALKAYRRINKNAGAQVGELYASNTFGCIIGSIAAGFVFIPRLGIENSLMTAAAVNLAVAAGLFFLSRGLSPAIRMGGVVAFSILGLSMGTRMPRWDGSLVATGVGSKAPDRLISLMFEEPGYNATVSVTLQQVQRPTLTLRTDGKPDASDTYDMPFQVQGGLISSLFHPNPENVLVVGLASATTCGAVLQDKRVKHMDVLEIEQAMVRASHFFDHMNNRPLDDPRTKLIEIDARNYYRVSPERYDVIVSEPSNPWMSGPSHLFTREAFAEAHGILKPGGMMLQWVQGYEFSAETAGAILKAFHDSFPHVRILKVHGANDTILLGSDAPITFDIKSLNTSLQPFLEELKRGGMEDAWDFMAELIGDEKSIEKLTAGMEANTDDNGLVEFRAPRDFDRQVQIYEWLDSGYEGPLDELKAQGFSVDEIAARMGWRRMDGYTPDATHWLLDWLKRQGRPELARAVYDLVHLNRTPAVATTRWEELLVRTRLWILDTPQPTFELADAEIPQGREFERMKLIQGLPDAKLQFEPHAFHSPNGALSMRLAAQRGDCERVGAALFEVRALQAATSDWGWARVMASAREVAAAFRLCNRPGEARAFEVLATIAQERAAGSLFDRFGTPVQSAYELASSDSRLSRAYADELCRWGDPREFNVLRDLVARESWHPSYAARFEYLEKQKPDPQSEAILKRTAPYRRTVADYDGSTCPMNRDVPGSTKPPLD